MSEELELLSRIISLILDTQNCSKMLLIYDKKKLDKYSGLQIRIDNNKITLINKKKSD